MAGCWSTLKKWKTRNLLTIEKLKLVKIVKMVLKEIFISALLGLLVSNIAFAKEKAMPIDSGRIIASGYGFGQIWAFPSNEMDGIFYFNAAALMGVWNSIHFYDFREHRNITVVSGGHEDGVGSLTDKLRHRSLVGEGRTSGVTGLIEEVILDDEGCLIFESEDSNHHQISFKDERKLVVSDVNINAFDVKTRFMLRPEEMNTPQDEMVFSSYKKTIETKTIKVEARNREIQLSIGNTICLIKGLNVFGLQLSQDSTQLAVFGRVSLLDIKSDANGSGFLFATEEEKNKRIEEMKQEFLEMGTDPEAAERWQQELLGEIWNIIVVYDLKSLPFAVEGKSTPRCKGGG